MADIQLSDHLDHS